MRETPRAQAAFNDYLAMGPNRSLEKLLALYREQSGSENSVPTLRMSTLTGWSVAHAWQQRLADIAEAERQAIVTQGIADKVERVKRQNDRWDRIQRLLDARAEANADLPGGDTGLVVREVTYLPGGATRERHEFDAAVLRELRELEKHTAQELGQWTEKKELTGKDGGPLEVKVDDARERLIARLAALAERRREAGSDSRPESSGSGEAAV
ncbi:hypothetical protein [Halomonas sp.]|uniref:hypothetical protein n=1 Tax=Halomonas sp. TaxID=1486246 RepID=UPI003D0D741D